MYTNLLAIVKVYNVQLYVLCSCKNHTGHNDEEYF